MFAAAGAQLDLTLLAMLGSATLLLLLAYRTTIPYPILLVVGGAAVGFVPGLPDIELEPDAVEGEALVNDATALVAYKVPLAAVLTGTLSAAEAGGSFVLDSAPGIAIGIAVGATRVDELAGDEWVRDESAQRLRSLHEFRTRRFKARFDEDDDGAIDDRSFAYQRLQREVLRAQHEEIIRLRNERFINDEVLRRIEHDLDLEDARLEIPLNGGPPVVPAIADG